MQADIFQQGFNNHLSLPPLLNSTPAGRKNFDEGVEPSKLSSGDPLIPKSRVGGSIISVKPGENIQEAIDETYLRGGGLVFLETGTHYPRATIQVKNNVTLKGAGNFATIIDFEGAAYNLQMIGEDSYNTGTVSVTQDSTTITGSGTTFTSSMVGQSILLDGDWYDISAFVSTTEITLESAFSGVTQSGVSYIIATVNTAPILMDCTVQNSSGSVISSQYSYLASIYNVAVYTGNKGIDFQDCVFPVVDNIEVADCTTAIYMDNCWGYSLTSFYLYNCTGNGILSNNSGDSILINFGVSNCGGVGIKFTDTEKVAINGFTIDSNGSHGLEFVSGCNDNTLTAGTINDNVGDGIKLTATSDRNSVSQVQFVDNGGYGVDVAASSDNDNVILGDSFSGNASGATLDAGTSTVIGMNVGDGSSVITEKYGADSGSNDTYVITTKPVTRAYAIGQKFIFRANTANTGAATLNVDGLGAITIKKKSATDLANNDILAGQLVEVAYNAADTPNVTLDSYSEANKDGNYALRSTAGSARGVAQTFDVGATTSILTSVKFHLAKVGSPTGNAVAKIYALTGSAGTTGKPTGTALAVSNNFDVSTLTTSFVLTTLNFSGLDQITLSASTTYCVAIEYSGGNTSNYLSVGRDDSAPSHAGNASYTTDDITWTEDGTDICFYVIATTLATQRFEMLSQISN